MEEPDVCLLCGDDSETLVSGWYGYSGPLCKSCRHLVVVKHDNEHPTIHPWSGQNYSHVKLGRGEGSQKQLFAGYEARVTAKSFPYYRSVLAFITREVAKPPQERAKYLEVSRSHSRLFRPAEATTEPLRAIPSGPSILDEMREEKEHRQLTLFSDFPPK